MCNALPTLLQQPKCEFPSSRSSVPSLHPQKVKR